MVFAQNQEIRDSPDIRGNLDNLDNLDIPGIVDKLPCTIGSYRKLYQDMIRR